MHASTDAAGNGMPAGDMNAVPAGSEMPMGGMLSAPVETMPIGAMASPAAAAEAQPGAAMPAGGMLGQEAGGMPMGAMPAGSADAWNMDLAQPQSCGCG